MKHTSKARHNFQMHPIALAVSSAIAIISAPVLAETEEVNKVEIIGQAENSYVEKKSSSIKLTQDLIDTPKTINIVNEKVLKDQGVTTLEDALRNVAGVSTFGAGEGGGGNVTTADAITIRGFDVNDSIFIDGIRDIAGYTRDTYNTEQVEITKGSSSSTAGQTAAGGSINLVTKTAHLSGDDSSLQASYDSGNNLRLTGDINTIISEDSALRLNLLAEKGGDYLDNGVEDGQTGGIAASYFKKISEKTDLTLNFSYINQDNTSALGLPFITEDAAASLGLSEGPIDDSLWDNYYGVEGFDSDEFNATSLTLVVNHELESGWKLRSQTRIGRSEREAIYSRPTLDTTDPTLVTTDRNGSFSYRDEYEDNSLFVTQLDAVGEILAGSTKHDIVVGTEYYREKREEPTVDVSGITRSAITTDFRNPSRITSTGSVTTDGNDADLTSQGIAAYVIDTITLNDQWQISGGLRAEHFEIEGFRTSRGNKVNADLSSNFFSWHTGVNFKPTENSSIYASVSNSQQANGSNLSFEGNSEEDAEDFDSLDPIESRTYEIGTKWAFNNDRLILGAAIYETRQDVYDEDDEGNNTTSGEERNRGIELNLTGVINDHFSVTAALAHQDSEVTENSDSDDVGDGLTAAPENTASIWLNYEKGPLTLGAGVQYSSGNEYIRRSEVAYDSGSVTLVNAMAAYQFSDQLSAQFNVTNLTDEKYVTDYSARGHFNVGQPRTAKITLNYDF